MLLDATRTSSLTEEHRPGGPGGPLGAAPGKRSLSELTAAVEPSQALRAGEPAGDELGEELGDDDEVGGDVDMVQTLGGSAHHQPVAPAEAPQTMVAPQTVVAPQPVAPAEAPPVQRKARTAKVGGNDALGRKENTLLQWKQEMIEVSAELAARFVPLGLKFRPQILLATAMQEAAVKDPLNAVSFDNGLGLMQITPYKGKLDPEVAQAIGWDNSKSVAANKRSANWRNAKANLRAGALTMLGKAKAIKRGVPATWEKMDEAHRWRAVLFGYNAGEGAAIAALKRGGPNAQMISTFTDPKGRRVSHDYTKEIKEKMDYVESHDPFGDGAQTEAPERDAPDEGRADSGGDSARQEEPGGGKASGDLRGAITASVGRGGQNRRADVGAVQERLQERGVSPGKVDQLIGPKTIGAIERFQDATLGFSDGLISPGKNTEKALFGGGGKVTEPRPDGKDGGAQRDEARDRDDDKDEAREEKDYPGWAAIAASFGAKIPGTAFTWHEAFWLPSYGRHVKPSDVTNISMDALIANVVRQAEALTKVREALGKAIVVHVWVRPPAYNRKIGGATNSSHLRGTATDFHVAGMSAEQVRQAVKSRKLYPGAGENNVSWVHLDLEHKTWFNP
jgi:peptidoglycan hydrolase-like protein with peptidoglycan-binding domain